MAAKLRFRLEPVLTVRQRGYEQAQRVVAARLRSIGREQLLGSAAEAELDAHLGALRVLQRGGRVDLSGVQINRTYVVLLQRRLAECAQRIADHERELARERAEMIAARVKVRAMEKLKERRAARFAEQQARREAYEQNELGLQAHRRQAAGR